MTEGKYKALFLGAGAHMQCGVGQFTRLLCEAIERLDPDRCATDRRTLGAEGERRRRAINLDNRNRDIRHFIQRCGAARRQPASSDGGTAVEASAGPAHRRRALPASVASPNH